MSANGRTAMDFSAPEVAVPACAGRACSGCAGEHSPWLPGDEGCRQHRDEQAGADEARAP